MNPRKGPPWIHIPPDEGGQAPEYREGAQGLSSPQTSTKRLSTLKEGECATVVSIRGGRHMRARLCGLGLREASRIRLVKAAPFSGPLLLEDRDTGARIMIGRGMAESIEVSVGDPS